MNRLLRIAGWSLLLTVVTTGLILLVVHDPIQRRNVIIYAGVAYLSLGLMVNFGTSRQTRRMMDESNTARCGAAQAPEETDKAYRKSLPSGWILLISGMLLFIVEYLLAKALI